jgi:glycosyltransferase involved in cell wall biosynthesis
VRILFVTNDPPDPCRNPAERWTYLLLKGLCARGHTVALWAVAGTQAQIERARPHLEQLPLELHLHLAPPRPRGLANKMRTLRQPFTASIPQAMRDEIRERHETGAYDVLHVEHLQGYGHLAAGVPHAFVSVQMLNLIDLRGSGYRSWDFYKTKLLQYSSEIRLLRRFQHVRVLTPELAGVVRKINPRARVWTVPIAIEPADYAMRPDSDANTVGLIAGMRWEHSRQAAVRLLSDIWPAIHRRVPAARLLIAGWGAADVLAGHRHQPGVEILQDVPDAAQFFRRCSLLAYPLPFGGGLKGKILESMAYGVPVVTTTAGMSGIDATPGVHARVEDDDERFGDAVVELLQDAPLRRRVASAARTLVEQRYSPGPVVSQFEALYNSICRQ